MKGTVKTVFSTILVGVLSFAFAILHCSKDLRKPIQPEISTPVIGDEPLVEFEKEGFISSDLYRVVIIQPEGADNETSAEKTARMRALGSLRKYLQSKDMAIDHNVTARLLALIEENGRLVKSILKSNGRNVYYFDISRPRLSEYVLTISHKK